MEIEILETDSDTFTIYNETHIIGSGSWHKCKMNKTEYGSVIVETGNGYVIPNKIIEFYPSKIKQIIYKK